MALQKSWKQIARERTWKYNVNATTEGSPAKKEKLLDFSTRQSTQHKNLRKISVVV